MDSLEQYGSFTYRISQITELLFSLLAEVRISDAPVGLKNSSPDDAREVVCDPFQLRSGIVQFGLLLLLGCGKARLKLLDLAACQL